MPRAGFVGDGLFYGGAAVLLTDQVVAAVAVLIVSGVIAYAIAIGRERRSGSGTVDGSMGELIGLDRSQHAEPAHQA